MDNHQKESEQLGNKEPLYDEREEQNNLYGSLYPKENADKPNEENPQKSSKQTFTENTKENPQKKISKQTVTENTKENTKQISLTEKAQNDIKEDINQNNFICIKKSFYKGNNYKKTINFLNDENSEKQNCKTFCENQKIDFNFLPSNLKSLKQKPEPKTIIENEDDKIDNYDINMETNEDYSEIFYSNINGLSSDISTQDMLPQNIFIFKNK